MTIKQKQITIYEALSAIADVYLKSFMDYYYHDCSESMQITRCARDMMESVSKALGAPTTMINFIKAYRKADYIKAVKDYLEMNGDSCDLNSLGLPIRVTEKDLSAA